jgi:peptidyl-prolyl cis-trans isomerase D
MKTRLLLVLGLAAALPGCSFFRSIGFAENVPDPAAVAGDNTPAEPAHVVVQHVLISFDGASIPAVTRTRDEAERLAQRVLEEARAGRDFAELVRYYTDDRGGDGTYALANWGVPTAAGEVDRQKMVRGFGNLAFTLPVAEIGIVEYDPNSSPFGWHVMKRVR